MWWHLTQSIIHNRKQQYFYRFHKNLRKCNGDSFFFVGIVQTSEVEMITLARLEIGIVILTWQIPDKYAMIGYLTVESPGKESSKFATRFGASRRYMGF